MFFFRTFLVLALILSHQAWASQFPPCVGLVVRANQPNSPLSVPQRSFFHFGEKGLSVIIGEGVSHQGWESPTIRIVYGSLVLKGDQGIALDVFGQTIPGFKGGTEAREFLDETFEVVKMTQKNNRIALHGRRINTHKNTLFQSVDALIPDRIEIEMSSTSSPSVILGVRFIRKNRFWNRRQEIAFWDEDTLQKAHREFHFKGLKLEGEAAATVISQLEEIPDSAYYDGNGRVNFRGASLSIGNGPQIQFPASLTPVEIIAVLNGFYHWGVRPDSIRTIGLHPILKLP